MFLRKLLGINNFRKQRFCYARLNPEQRCISVWCFDEPSERTDLIAIDSLDQNKIGKTWNGARWIRPSLQRQSDMDYTVSHDVNLKSA